MENGELKLRRVAVFHSPFKEKFGVPRQAGVVPQLLGRIVLEKDFRTPEAIRGMDGTTGSPTDGFDYLWLLWGFSKNKHEAKGVTVRPPRLGGNQSLGVFATRSPYRPNPIGLSSVRIDHIDYDCPDAPVIYVRGADLVDGTPIYDIKPYIPYTDSHPEAKGGFTDRVGWKPLDVVLLVDCPSDIDSEELSVVLAQDPRPHYHDDEERVYGMKYGEYDVRFQVKERKVIVVEIKKC